MLSHYVVEHASWFRWRHLIFPNSLQLKPSFPGVGGVHQGLDEITTYSTEQTDTYGVLIPVHLLNFCRFITTIYLDNGVKTDGLSETSGTFRKDEGGSCRIKTNLLDVFKGRQLLRFTIPKWVLVLSLRW